jgi:hypothetical protein
MSIFCHSKRPLLVAGILVQRYRWSVFWKVLYLCFNNSSFGLTKTKIGDSAEYVERGKKFQRSWLFQMKLVFHVFITQKRFEIQNRQILQFALYSFIHNFWSTIPIRIINLSSSGKLHCCYLTPLYFPLNPFYFNRFLTAAEILTNLLISAGVIWPFQKNWRIFLTMPIYS